MEYLDSDPGYKPDEFLFEYDPQRGFNYAEFLALSTPTMYNFFEDTDNIDIDVEGMEMSVDIKDVDYSPEIEDMFRRIGIPALNGKKNAVYVHEMTYINAVVSYTTQDHKGREEEHVGTFPLNLEGMIIIYPKGLLVFT